jgi:putative DNA methylase
MLTVPTASTPVQAGGTAVALFSPLRHLNTDEISAKSRREARNREIQLPPVSAYRWWARRTEAVNGAVIDAMSRDQPGCLVISDPFAGGGVIPLAAVLRGHRVYAQDLNPWASAGLAAMLALPDPDALRAGVAALTQRMLPIVTAAYGTVLSDGSCGQVSHTFRVATGSCTACGRRQRLFPYALVSLLARTERHRPEAFLACPRGHLFRGQRDQIARCPTCGDRTDPAAAYTPGRIATCRCCGHAERLESRAKDGLDWEVVLVERAGPTGRELDLPTDGERAAAEDPRWDPTRTLGRIEPGQETGVLLRHGFRNWEDLYPRRQRALVERLLTLADGCADDIAVVATLRMAVIGSTEMAGLLSRWDRFYLKSYESMAGHRFNFTTLAVEPNAWGTVTSGRGTTLRRLVRLVKAAEWLRRRTNRTLRVSGPLPAATTPTATLHQDDSPDVIVVAGSSERQLLPSGSAHLVLTDPPYHDDVQYGELSQPLRAWADLPAGNDAGDAVVNRVIGQLTATGAYSALLTRIFRESRRLLRVDGHLIFSYANRSLSAWTELIGALQAAGLRAAGCEIVHSENETDHAKRGVRACTLDLLLDLVPACTLPVVTHFPTGGRGPEADFLRLVARYVLQVGALPAGWAESFSAEAAAAPFLAKPGSRSV